MSPVRPVAEADLHAYVDGALDAARRAEIDTYLERHPEMAARVRTYQLQREMLRARLAPMVEEPIPPQLNLAQMIAARSQPRRSNFWRAAAAAILLVGVGGTGGWSLHGAAEPHLVGVAALAQEAAYTYSVYSGDFTHPVQINAANSADLVSWISNRLNRNIVIPDLSASGYRFMGGSLVATPHGPAGMLMYDNDQGTRLVMLVRLMGDNIDLNTPKMLPYANGAIAGFSWAHHGVGYSLIGAVPATDLHPVANAARAQLNAI